MPATCTTCGLQFSGEPWRYNNDGVRVHVDCSRAHPKLGPPPATAQTWDLLPLPAGTSRAEQVRWRNEVRRLAEAEPDGWWTAVAVDLLAWRRGYSKAQGRLIGAMRRDHRRAAGTVRIS